MKLLIDGREYIAETGQSLRQIVSQMGLDSRNLSRRPIAAKISGEVFNLN